MTGYGSGSAETGNARLTVEIRGVNQRHLDVRIAAPREYAASERELRERVAAVAQRGRVEVGVTRTPIAARRRYAVSLRLELARAYVDAARRLARTLHLDGRVGLADVLRLPDLFEVTENPPDVRRELPALRRALGQALAAFDAERRREGRHLQRDMQARATALRRAAAAVRARVPTALAALRRQVEERVSRVVGAVAVDAGRVAQEVAVLAERSDVTEEIVRLDSHLAALAAALREAGPVGKRVEFLLQEIQRELNTTAAKASDAAIGALVLDAKGDVEKLREQVQNVE